MPPRMTHVDLFSGIGGFALAADWAGMDTVVFCEKEKYCQKIISQNWPGIPIIGDIRDFRWPDAIIQDTIGHGRILGINEINGSGGGIGDSGPGDQIGICGQEEPVTLVTGGFPCQPFSQAGRKRGRADDRFLWPEMYRCISEIRPHWVIGENVIGITRLGLNGVVSDMEALGYSVRCFEIPSCAVDARHQRLRTWIVCHNDSRGSTPGNVQDSKHHGRDGTQIPGGPGARIRTQAGEIGTKQSPGSGGRPGGDEDLANPQGLTIRPGSGQVNQAELGGGRFGHGRVKGSDDVAVPIGHPQGASYGIPLGPGDGEWDDKDLGSGGEIRGHITNGRPNVSHTSRGREIPRPKRGASVIPDQEGVSRWIPEPGMGRVADGVPHRVDRIKALGNAIVPQVAFRIIKAIADVEKKIQDGWDLK